MNFKVKKYNFSTSACIQIKSLNKYILLLIDNHDEDGLVLIWMGSPKLSNIHKFIRSLRFPDSYKYESSIIITDKENGDQLINANVQKSITPFPHKDDITVLKNKTLFVRYDIYTKTTNKALAIYISLSGEKTNYRETGMKATLKFYRKNIDKLLSLITNTHTHNMNKVQVREALNMILDEYEQDQKLKTQ